MVRRIAAIGLGDEMLAFSCVGVEAYGVGSAEEARAKLDELGNCAVVFVSERLIGGLGGAHGTYPVVLAVPALEEGVK